MNSIEMKIKKYKLSKMYTALVVFMPITHVYAIPVLKGGVSFGELLLIMLLPILIVYQVKKDIKLLVGNPLWVYLFYSLISTLFASILLVIHSHDYDISNMIVRVVRDSFYFLLVLFWGKDFFDFESGKRILLIVSKVAAVFMIVQFVAYQIMNVSILGFIPGMTTTISGGVVSNELVERFLQTASYNGYLRVYGFFSEPAAAAQFLAAALLLIFFFSENKRIDFKWAAILSIAVVLTFSVTGYITLILCWGLMFIKAPKSIHTRRMCAVIAFLLLLSLPLVLHNNFINGVFGRVVSLFKGESTQNSAAIRVLRGPAFFLNMPLFYQIFGSGFGNFDDFKSIYEINTLYEQVAEYLNTNAYVAISSGIIGFLLYIRGIWLNTKRKPFFAKSVALLVFVLGFACSLYSSPVYVIYLLLIINCPMERIEND